MFKSNKIAQKAYLRDAMNSTALHLISFDYPDPPAYGGLIDVYYKLKALHQQGVRIHLHAFYEGEEPKVSPEMQKMTASVQLYKRSKKQQWYRFFSLQPFSVATRQDEQLLANLLNDDLPILFEGLQTCALATHPALQQRRKFLRLHNIESKYYRGSAKSSSSFIQRWIYQVEALRYARMERDFSHFETVYCLAHAERDFVSTRQGNALFIPPFTGLNQVSALSSKGEGVLYYGDLRLPDNQRAALFLIDVMAPLTAIPFCIAAQDCPGRIREALAKHSHMQFKKTVGLSALEIEWERAHLHLLWSFQQSGTKLKALNAFFRGRHVVLNKNLVDDPKVIELGHLVENVGQARQTVQQLIAQPYADHDKRAAVLEQHYSDAVHAKRLVADWLKR